jgi:1-acyl-sn-glycerol-3-phosphate acyltransferase
MIFRQVLYLVAITVFTSWYGFKVMIAAALGVKQRPGGVYDESCRRWSRNVLKWSGIEVHTKGLANIPTEKPVVYVANHQSFFDILTLGATLPGTFRFVAKRELKKIPIMAGSLKAAGHIYIDRQRRQSAFGSYQKAAEIVKGGVSALVFGEGTRSRTGNLLPFKKGPFVLAIAAQVPVLPVYCAHTFGILPKGEWRIHPHPVTLYFGEPIPTAGMDYEDRKDLLKKTQRVIEGFCVDAKRDSE